MSVKFDKKYLRSCFLSNLKNNSKIYAKSKSYKAINVLFKLIKFSKCKNILLYLPMFYELDVYRLRKKLHTGYNILVPFMVRLSLKMVKLKLPFVVRRFNVRETKQQNEYKKRIDMAVLPAVGVDGNMARIGHGAGFYDRFFAGLKYRPKFIVFVSVTDNYTPLKVSQEHDLIGDFYITPSKNYIRKRGNYDRDFIRFRGRCGWRWSRVRVCKKDQ